MLLGFVAFLRWLVLVLHLEWIAELIGALVDRLRPDPYDSRWDDPDWGDELDGDGFDGSFF